MGQSPPFYVVPGGTLGIVCPFAAIFAVFGRPVTALAAFSGTFFFHQRLAFTGS
jgi:hypothetical protein